MKKLFLGLSVLFCMVLFFGFTTQAEEVSEDEFVDPGTMPGDFFYGFDKFFENVALRLTFSDEKKAEKLSQIAEERLAELNELDSEKADEYAEALFNEYGLSLEKANIYIAKLIAEGEISEEKLERLERNAEKAYTKRERIKNEVKEKISNEVKEQVQNAIQNAKASIFSRFTDVEEAKALHEDGYGYGQILVLQAFADLSGQTIDDILLIDGAVTVDSENEKEINRDVLFEALSITQDQLKEKLDEYREEAKTMAKEKMNEAKENAEQRSSEIKERVQERIEQRKNKTNDEE